MISAFDVRLTMQDPVFPATAGQAAAYEAAPAPAGDAPMLFVVFQAAMQPIGQM